MRNEFKKIPINPYSKIFLISKEKYTQAVYFFKRKIVASF